jgi:acyl-CoA synthetase (NDP forming)
MHTSASGAAAVGRLMRPHSVAIVGISSKAGSAGQTVLENLKVNNFTGDIHLVGRANEIDGRPVRPSVDDLPEGIDLAIFTLPQGAGGRGVLLRVRRSERGDAAAAE